MSALISAFDLAERGLEGAGAAGRIIVVSESVDAEVRYANNTVTTNGTRRDRQIAVIEFDARSDGIAAGVASGSGAGLLELADLVAAARTDAASAAAADDAFELVGPRDGSTDCSSPFTDEPVSTDLAVLKPVISSLGEIFTRAVDSRRVAAGFARHSVTTTYLASSTGLRQRAVVPDGRVELVARSLDGTRSAWAGACTSWFDDIDMAALEGRVVRGLGWAERKVELEAGRYETILPGDAVADLMVIMSLSGREAEEGRTVFSAPGGGTRVGERLSELGFVLRGDPAERGLETAANVVTGASTADESVFDNGAPIGRTEWISEGTLSRLCYHRAGASRSNVPFAPPTGNMVLELPGATKSLDELVASSERTLLVTCLWYVREVDPATMLLTGLTRDGVYLVEHGEVVGAVNNFRFNESPVDVLAHSVEVGTTSRVLSREWGQWFSRTAMPPLRVADFNMSSVSPAT